jgi:hypothetical protein
MARRPLGAARRTAAGRHYAGQRQIAGDRGDAPGRHPCSVAGAMRQLLGVVPPTEFWKASVSAGDAGALGYLAELVTTARRQGMGPGDFGLRRVTVNG